MFAHSKLAERAVWPVGRAVTAAPSCWIFGPRSPWVSCARSCRALASDWKSASRPPSQDLRPQHCSRAPPPCF
eukprot:8202769-Alexandrium_andersonii.AAC.1